MIGLVIVSHSARLAEGVRELALQMSGDEVRIGIAGGIDDPENPIGTDPMRVVEAITEVYHEDGVVIMMDLGSALMSAEMALEFVDPTWRPNIYLCEAPLIEGTVAAAVQASIGASVDAVMSEARASLSVKQHHLAPPAETEGSEAKAQTVPEISETLTLTVPNAQGIHARPAARIVKLAARFPASLTIAHSDKRVDGASVNQVALLNARQGDALQFIASGDGASDLLAALRALAEENFGDAAETVSGPSVPEPTPDDLPEGAIGGVRASRGLAIGPAFQLNDQLPTVEDVQVDDPSAELAHLQSAVEAAVAELEALVSRASNKIGKQEAAIFEAQVMMLRDPDLQAAAMRKIQDNHSSAAYAWWQSVESTVAAYRNSANVLLHERAQDVIDVGSRVLKRLQTNGASGAQEIPKGSILVAADLTPSRMADLNVADVSGIVTAHGGATSHVAIIARSMGVPMVAGIGDALAKITNGAPIILDGDQGYVYPQPSEDQLAASQAEYASRQEAQAALIAASRQPAMTSDGRRIEVAANVGTVADSERIAAVGAEGIGLFRTELLFMGRSSAPTEEEQFEAYSVAARNLPDCPIIIRTLDVGGDKAIDYIQIDPEENPFLGYRGIRYWIDNPDLARAQLRAICRASADHPIRVMFPMIGTLDELLAAKSLLADVQNNLSKASIPYDDGMQIGIMIEVPSAVLIADQLAQHVDFFSIGTNDLTQYTLAADRGNPKVANLTNPFQPAVIRAIKTVVDAAHAHGKWTGMCGEMAGNPLATPLLVGLGLDELSMSAASIPEVKAIIRDLDAESARKLAADVLALQSVADITNYLKTSPALR